MQADPNTVVRSSVHSTQPGTLLLATPQAPDAKAKSLAHGSPPADAA
ncbi:hypothetical protein ACWEQL_03800 [Kitasatospora sp. NPDC004240]